MIIWPVKSNCRFENKPQLFIPKQGYFYKEIQKILLLRNALFKLILNSNFQLKKEEFGNSTIDKNILQLLLFIFSIQMQIEKKSYTCTVHNLLSNGKASSRLICLHPKIRPVRIFSNPVGTILCGAGWRNLPPWLE